MSNVDKGRLRRCCEAIKNFLASFVHMCLSLKVDALLVALAGIMAIMTAAVGYKNTHAQRYRLVVIGSTESDVIAHCCISLVIVGIIDLIAGALKSSSNSRITPVKFVLLIVITLVCNFCVAVKLTDYRNHVAKGLESSMMEQLKAAILGRQRFGVGFELAESWDFMQMKLLCCGVNSHKDYAELGGVGSIHSDSPTPISCCAMKYTDPPMPDNLRQCELDSKNGVSKSLFLHTQGCHSPLSRWLIRHINKIAAMIFGTICLQALGVFYGTWVGFKRSFATSHGHRLQQQH